jgi:excisionase family DNA binding protein
VTTLPPAPENWNIERLNGERTESVAAFGFTERQARFLVEVMIHSGVFVERQYCSFAGIVHGQKTHDFLRKIACLHPRFVDARRLQRPARFSASPTKHHLRDRQSRATRFELAIGGPGRRGIMKTWLTVAEAATHSGVSRDTIYTACERGELRHARIGGRRAIRLKAEWIDAWLERHVRGASATDGNASYTQHHINARAGGES